MRIWRISNHADLSGQGGVVAAARWNLVRTPVVYCADHPAAALLEMLVHIDPEDAPPTYRLLSIEVPEPLDIHTPELPDDWKEDLAFTQNLGSSFIAAGSAAVMAVPSAIVPFASNYLLNPLLLEEAGIRIVGVTEHPIDPRLLGLR
jgi:RES domain-containing protein